MESITVRVDLLKRGGTWCVVGQDGATLGGLNEDAVRAIRDGRAMTSMDFEAIPWLAASRSIVGQLARNEAAHKSRSECEWARKCGNLSGTLNRTAKRGKPSRWSNDPANSWGERIKRVVGQVQQKAWRNSCDAWIRRTEQIQRSMRRREAERQGHGQEGAADT